MLTHGLYRLLPHHGREQSSTGDRLYFLLALHKSFTRVAYGTSYVRDLGEQIDHAPPPSLTWAATIQMQLTAKGERSCKASYVSMLPSKIGKNVEQP